MGWIKYDGRLSTDYDLVVETTPNYLTAEPNIEKISILGRNGDLLINNNTFKNRQQVYNIAAVKPTKDFNYLKRQIISWISQSQDYVRIEDSYDPTVYNMGIYTGAFQITNISNQAARAQVIFDCMPQHFLKMGDTPVHIDGPTARRILANPTGEITMPHIAIRATGKCNVQIGNYKVEIEGASDNRTIIINGQMPHIYTIHGPLIYTEKVRLINGFPKLIAGENEISFAGVSGGSVRYVEVRPRWWTR